MKVIKIHRLQLNFDSNGHPKAQQARHMLDTINKLLQENDQLVGGAQLIDYSDEIEIEEEETE